MMINLEYTPKIGVYTICKNESKFVRTWVKSMYANGKGADRAYVLDTGSTDGTVEVFKQVLAELSIPSSWLRIITKTYNQFRFDVARNDNLAMVKYDEDWLDVLVSVDLDEIMIEDFWVDLRETVKEHPNFNRIFYLYAWNHDENGNPKRVFWYDKVHPVRGCRWIHPVHEELVIDNPNCFGKYKLCNDKIYLHHWPDLTKSRSSYLPLLEIRAEENPNDICGLYYLVREYLFNDATSLNALNLAHLMYTRMLSGDLATTGDDYDCLLFFTIAIADIYCARGMKDEAEFFYKKAIQINDKVRQPYIQYASMAAYQGKYKLAFKLLDTMEQKVPTKYTTWYESDINWTWKPLQIRAVALCWAGKYAAALTTFKEAEANYILTPTDVTEADSAGFYEDYQWLKDYLDNDNNAI